jgi:hypothetical protein
MLCAQVCSDGGLSESVLVLDRPWGEKCVLSFLGLLLNCSAHSVCHPFFRNQGLCSVVFKFIRSNHKQQAEQVAKYACSVLANLFAGDCCTRQFLISHQPQVLSDVLARAGQCCASAALVLKNVCCCCSSDECSYLSITGARLVSLVRCSLLHSTDCAEVAAAALQCFCVHSQLQPHQLRSLVDLLPSSGNIRGSLIAALANASLLGECCAVQLSRAVTCSASPAFFLVTFTAAKSTDFSPAFGFCSNGCDGDIFIHCLDAATARDPCRAAAASLFGHVAIGLAANIQNFLTVSSMQRLLSVLRVALSDSDGALVEGSLATFWNIAASEGHAEVLITQV